MNSRPATPTDKQAGPRLCYVITSEASTMLLRGQLRWMRCAGYHVTLVASGGEKLRHFCESEGVDCISTPIVREISPIADLLSLIRLALLFLRIRPQVVNASTPKAGLLGMMAATLARTPCRVYVVRGLRLETVRGFKRCVLWATEWMACRLAHRVVCISPSLRSACLQIGVVAQEKTLVIGAGSSNGVDTEGVLVQGSATARSTRKRFRRAWGLPPDAFVFGIVGRITADKGISDVVAAFTYVAKQCRDARLLLVGAWEEGDPVDKATRRRVEQDSRIVCTGFLEDCREAYAAMDVLVHPSVREGFGNAPAEASASGLPVIARRVTGVVDAVAENRTGLLVQASGHAPLAEAMLCYHGDRDLAVNHGEAGRARVLREFRPEQVWRGLEELYCRLQRHAGLNPPHTVGTSDPELQAA